jgi:hypothetical protein
MRTRRSSPVMSPLIRGAAGHAVCPPAGYRAAGRPPAARHPQRRTGQDPALTHRGRAADPDPRRPPGHRLPPGAVGRAGVRRAARPARRRDHGDPGRGSGSVARTPGRPSPSSSKTPTCGYCTTARNSACTRGPAPARSAATAPMHHANQNDHVKNVPRIRPVQHLPRPHTTPSTGLRSGAYAGSR